MSSTAIGVPRSSSDTLLPTSWDDLRSRRQCDQYHQDQREDLHPARFHHSACHHGTHLLEVSPPLAGGAQGHRRIMDFPSPQGSERPGEGQRLGIRRCDFFVGRGSAKPEWVGLDRTPGCLGKNATKSVNCSEPTWAGRGQGYVMGRRQSIQVSEGVWTKPTARAASRCGGVLYFRRFPGRRPRPISGFRPPEPCPRPTRPSNSQ